MYVCNDAKKMVIQFNSNDETEMPVTSDFRLRTSLPTGQAGDMFEIKYRVTCKEADCHYKNQTE
jgi:hypothetical protein